MIEERDEAEPMKSGATSRTETAVAESPEQCREQRYRQVAELLREWKNEETGYDDEVWPLVEGDIPALRMRCPE